VKTVSRDKKF